MYDFRKLKNKYSFHQTIQSENKASFMVLSNLFKFSTIAKT
jgi:hypothetical protein